MYGYNGVSTGLQSCLQMLEALAGQLDPAMVPAITEQYKRVVRVREEEKSKGKAKGGRSEGKGEGGREGRSKGKGEERRQGICL